jgi:hypothetical protein
MAFFGLVLFAFGGLLIRGLTFCLVVVCCVGTLVGPFFLQM